MKLIFLEDNDIVNFKLNSMFLGFPKCSFKCGADFCQNAALMNEPPIDISIEDLVKRYQENPLSHAIVCGGLEPLDTPVELGVAIINFRKVTNDPIVIYTGYTQKEKEHFIKQFGLYDNIIVKYGRYIPNRPSRYDDLLGVELASDNQYAVLYRKVNNGTKWIHSL